MNSLQFDNSLVTQSQLISYLEKTMWPYITSNQGLKNVDLQIKDKQYIQRI